MAVTHVWKSLNYTFINKTLLSIAYFGYLRSSNGRYTYVKKLLYKGLSIKVIGNMLAENCEKQRYPQ